LRAQFLVEQLPRARQKVSVWKPMSGSSLLCFPIETRNAKKKSIGLLRCSLALYPPPGISPILKNISLFTSAFHWPRRSGRTSPVHSGPCRFWSVFRFPRWPGHDTSGEGTDNFWRSEVRGVRLLERRRHRGSFPCSVRMPRCSGPLGVPPPGWGCECNGDIFDNNPQIDGSVRSPGATACRCGTRRLNRWGKNGPSRVLGYIRLQSTFVAPGQ
jgi:hypothetical protein